MLYYNNNGHKSFKFKRSKTRLLYKFHTYRVFFMTLFLIDVLSWMFSQVISSYKKIYFAVVCPIKNMTMTLKRLYIIF